VAEGRAGEGRPAQRPPAAEGREATLERLDAVDAEYRKRVEEMRQLEARLARLELRFDRMAPRTELGELKSRVDGIDEQLRALEEELGS
jgi:predicted nuclease with TOPRIM domain